MADSVAGAAACSLAQAALLCAAVDLLEHGGHHSKERNDQASEGKKERGGLPERCIAGKSGLQSRAEQGHAAGDQREEQESRGKNVKITGHSFYFIAPAECPRFNGFPSDLARIRPASAANSRRRP